MKRLKTNEEKYMKRMDRRKIGKKIESWIMIPGSAEDLELCVLAEQK
jgi:hypothetical protein